MVEIKDENKIKIANAIIIYCILYRLLYDDVVGTKYNYQILIQNPNHDTNLWLNLKKVYSDIINDVDTSRYINLKTNEYMEKLAIKANDEYKKLKSKIEAESKYSEKYHERFSDDRDEDEYFDGGSEYLLKDSKKKKILINSKYEEYSIIYRHVIRTYIELFCSFILTDE